jgi:hypothetical protein
MPEPRWGLARSAVPGPRSITCSTSSPAGPVLGGGGDRAIAAEQGVVHQGGEALLQAVGVGGLEGEALVQFEQHVVGQQRLAAQVQATGIVAGQIEQVVHERGHALGLLLDQLKGGGPRRSRPSAWPAIRVIGVRSSWLRIGRDSARSQQGQAPDEGIGPIVASGVPRCPGPHELQPERYRSN